MNAGLIPTRLREDFLGELGRRLGRSIDPKALPEPAARELGKLQGACEQFEAVFVKQLLSQMRRTTLAKEAKGYSDMAYDFMDQSVADSVVRGRAGLGIARTLFLDVASKLPSINADSSEKTNG